MPKNVAADGRLVLVVDDDADFCIAMRHLLAANGFRVVVAANGLEALTVLSKFDVAIVLTDLFMPRMDGIELIRQLRKREHPTPSIIAVTGNAHVAAEATSIAAAILGAHAALLKPFSQEDLMQVIHGLSDEGNVESTV